MHTPRAHSKTFRMYYVGVNGSYTVLLIAVVLSEHVGMLLFPKEICAIRQAPYLRGHVVVGLKYCMQNKWLMDGFRPMMHVKKMCGRKDGKSLVNIIR